VEDIRNTYRIIVSKPECLDTQMWRGYNIKMDFKEVDSEKRIKWLKMAQGCVQ
jgi:hypothetical protein